MTGVSKYVVERKKKHKFSETINDRPVVSHGHEPSQLN